MESSKNLSGSEQKINEYTERIRNGEDAGKVMEGLGSFMRDAIEKKLLQQENLQNTETKDLAIIPSQYEGLNSEALDFIWEVPEYLDPEKTKQEKERKTNALTYLREQEKGMEQKEERKAGDQKKIEKIREELGLSKIEKRDFKGDEQLEGIYDTLQNIAGGAKEGLQEDIERKIEKYINEIKSGKDKEYVLGGIPEKWRAIVEDRLALEKIGVEQKEVKKNFDSLSDMEIESFMKSLPRIPAAEGSRMTIIDTKLLQSKTIRSLSPGDRIYTLKDTYITAEVLPPDPTQSDIGQIRLKLNDGTIWKTNVIIDTYLLEDIRKIYENS